ncbi:ATPase [Lewinellaceae bacterium SD302]|nr:ATPase [Lewinellaceae bacterium SD302]
MKILVTGPESSGKTTLCNQLAREYGAVVRPEYARTYLNESGPKYDLEDLIKIWETQVNIEKTLDEEKDLLFCDTGHFVMAIWNEVKFQSPRLSMDQLADDLPLNYAHVLLCSPDLPWIADPQRENPDLRERKALFERYRGLIEAQGMTYSVISGMEDRMGMALKALDLAPPSIVS